MPPFRAIIRDMYAPGLSAEGTAKVRTAVQSFEEAFNSDFFRDAICSFGAPDGGFLFNAGLTANGVYERLITAMELQGNKERYVADLNLRIIPGLSPDGRTIGYVTNYSKVINTYAHFVLTLSLPALAAHFAHEWTHVLGFFHPLNMGSNTEVVKKTVPYAVEHMVERYLAEKQGGVIG